MSERSRSAHNPGSDALPLSQVQHHFMEYLLATEHTGTNAHYSALSTMTQSGSPPEGLQIYAHAYSARLIDALRTDHEKLSAFLGESEFIRLATAFVSAHPSTVRSLRDYGDALPDFLAASDHREAARAAQLAEFERLLLDVYDAADADQLTAESLQQLLPEHWPALRLTPHPALRLFFDRSNAVSAWQHHNGATPAPPLGQDTPDGNTPDENNEHHVQPWLVWRDRERICQFRHLQGAEHEAISALLLKQQTLAEAAEVLSTMVAADQLATALQQWLQQWLADGLVCELITD